MSTALDGSPRRRGRETGRLVLGSLLELGIKIYGAGAATAVALGDAETVAGKARDAANVVPILKDRYESTVYVAEHQQEIRTAINYVHANTPPQAELEAAVDQTSGTLRAIDTTYSELVRAKDSLGEFPPRPREVAGHVEAAWKAKPELDDLRELASTADRAGPYVEQARVLTDTYYGNLVALMDNFARDEIVATVSVMAVAFGIAFIIGRSVGFWVRRGRPGLVARTLQRWGAKRFRPWYVQNLPHAVGSPLYEVARERIQREIAADPQTQLDPEVHRALELYFTGRNTAT